MSLVETTFFVGVSLLSIACVIGNRKKNPRMLGYQLVNMSAPEPVFHCEPVLHCTPASHPPHKTLVEQKLQETAKRKGIEVDELSFNELDYHMRTYGTVLQKEEQIKLRIQVHDLNTRLSRPQGILDTVTFIQDHTDSDGNFVFHSGAYVYEYMEELRGCVNVVKTILNEDRIKSIAIACEEIEKLEKNERCACRHLLQVIQELRIEPRKYEYKDKKGYGRDPIEYLNIYYDMCHRYFREEVESYESMLMRASQVRRVLKRTK